MNHTFGNFLLAFILIILGFAATAWLLGVAKGCIVNVGACV